MSLALGLIAALCWGVHDICVRLVSQRAAILPSLLTVLFAGLFLVVPAALIAGEPAPPAALSLAALGGVLFGLTTGALWRAFRIGPVRIVAPIIGAYPVLSVGWAVLSGTPVTLWQWLAILLIVGGVAVVAGGSAEEEEAHAGEEGRAAAILWSIIAGAGFAVTFAVMQAASALGGEITVIAASRVAAFLAIGALTLAVHRGFHPPRGALPILAAMGFLDAVAHGAVTYAGGLPRPEYAAVAASIFGLLTVVFARVFLGEAMNARQWGGVFIVFAAIGYLAS